MFDFVPKLVLVEPKSSGYRYKLLPMIRSIETIGSIGSADTTDYEMNVSWIDNGVSWYDSNDASEQYNYSGNTYYYIAIG